MNNHILTEGLSVEDYLSAEDKELLERAREKGFDINLYWSAGIEETRPREEDEDDDSYEFRNIFLQFNAEICHDGEEISDIYSDVLYDAIRAPGEMVWTDETSDNLELFVEKVMWELEDHM